MCDFYLCHTDISPKTLTSCVIGLFSIQISSHVMMLAGNRSMPSPSQCGKKPHNYIKYAYFIKFI